MKDDDEIILAWIKNELPDMQGHLVAEFILKALTEIESNRPTLH